VSGAVGDWVLPRMRLMRASRLRPSSAALEENGTAVVREW
jgi:hypothetical protein